PTFGEVLAWAGWYRLVDEHGVVLVGLALAVLKPLKQWLGKCLFVLSVVEADTISLTSPQMKIQAAGPWLSSLRILTWAMNASILPSSHASERSPIHEGHPRIRVWRPLGPQA